MKKYLILVFMFLITGCVNMPLETSYIPAEISGWKVGHAYDDGFFGKGNIVEYIPENERINSWSKLITIQFLERQYDDPYEFMLKLEKSMRTRCKNASWEVLHKTEYAVLYRWSIDNCPGNTDQEEISKLMLGNDGLHRAAYTEKGRIESATKEKWISWLKSSYVEKNGEKVSIRRP